MEFLSTLVCCKTLFDKVNIYSMNNHFSGHPVYFLEKGRHNWVQQLWPSHLLWIWRQSRTVSKSQWQLRTFLLQLNCLKNWLGRRLLFFGPYPLEGRCEKKTFVERCIYRQKPQNSIVKVSVISQLLILSYSRLARSSRHILFHNSPFWQPSDFC